MALSDYRFREDGRPRIIHFSGGRTSAYLLFHTIEAYGGSIPSHIRVAYCNTGKEREETLSFIQRCSDEWNVEVTWLEYDFRPDARAGCTIPSMSIAWSASTRLRATASPSKP